MLDTDQFHYLSFFLPSLPPHLLQRVSSSLLVATPALVLAPFFTWLEILFMTVNYRPDLKKKIENEAGKRIVQMNKEKREKLEAKKAQ